jgi:hypothetical protein
MVFAGMLGIAAATAHAEQDATKIRKRFDLREALLRKFFYENHCPAERFSGVFVSEADSHELDWRLLPSLAVIETGGGRTAPGNNLFGWANGKTRFDSISEAIHTVAAALSFGSAYKGKDLFGKLKMYNQHANYTTKVTGLMNRIAPSPDVDTE